MGKTKKRTNGPRPAEPGNVPDDKPMTLKDMLGADTIAKLKRQADDLKQEEANRKETLRKEAEAAREAERKRREQDFGFLLENSSLDWKKYK